MDPDTLYIFFDARRSFVRSVIVGLFPPFHYLFPPLLIFCSPSVKHFEHLNNFGFTVFLRQGLTVWLRLASHLQSFCLGFPRPWIKMCSAYCVCNLFKYI